MNHARRARSTAVAILALGLGAGLGACGGREEPKTGNPGGKPQSPGVRTGTNPAQAAQTATTGDTSTLGATIKPTHKAKAR